MVNLTNDQKIDAIEYWQDDPMKHPLTCGHDSSHQPLVGFETEEGEVRLRCVDCEYEQDFIPEIVYEQYHQRVVEGDKTVPLYKTPQGMYTDLKASKEVYNKIYRKIPRPTEHAMIKSMLQDYEGDEGLLIDGELFNKNNIEEWEKKHPKRVAFLEYDEYECGMNCTPDGCEGHTNKHASGITINGVTLWVEGATEGDFPSQDEEYNDRVQTLLEEIEDYFNTKGATRKSTGK